MWQITHGRRLDGGTPGDSGAEADVAGEAPEPRTRSMPTSVLDYDQELISLFSHAPESLVSGSFAQNSDPSRCPPIRLRRTTQDDLPELFEMQIDPESNAMAVTNPRSSEGFAAHWDKVFQDSSTVPMVILLSDRIVGLVACFRSEHSHAIGYWIHRDYWGQGIATQALLQLLRDVPDRPLHAQAATSNKASLRVLEKCGFEIEEVCVEPASERYPECEVARFVLR